MATAPEAEFEFREALADYQASLDVNSDVVDDANQESLLPEITLDEDE
jgi:hypothetical protein